jgi:hypothetical protein
MLYSKKLLRDKPIYVVPYHNYVICAWAEIRRELDRPSLLLSLDHHTDTHPAFVRLASSQFPMFDDSGAWHEVATSFVNEIDFRNEASVEQAAHRLRNDEHIYAACEADIIRGGFIIQYHDFSGTPSLEEHAYNRSYNGMAWLFEVPRPVRPFRYALPYKGIFVVGAECAVGCGRQPHTDDCRRDHADQAIEAPYLETKLSVIREMSPALDVIALLSEEYILDIDLDYFATAASIEPKQPETFYRFVRNAKAVTIATEPEFVEHCRLEDELITADTLLPRLMSHIECALA